MRSSLPVVVALALSLALPSVGCKRMAERAREKAIEKAEEKAIERQTGGQVKVDKDKGTISVVTDGGAVTLGSGAKLPDDWPSAVPTYPAGKVAFAAKSASGGKDTWAASFETTDAKEKVGEYYKANMSGFKLNSSMDLGTSSAQVWQSPKYDVSVMIGTESSNKTSVTLSVSTR
jgi:hypothetical protein